MYLDDFESEARAHIEKIEASFLDTGSPEGDPALINEVFRAAHSLKGTAGFFSLEKIVAVAHELENVIMRIKDGELAINEEITDIALRSVDCLYDLVDNIRLEDNIDINEIIGMLKEYSGVHTPAKNNDNSFIAENVPFDIANPEIENTLRNAAKYGHKAYYVKIGYNRGLGKHYTNQKGFLDGILSIGSIVAAIVDEKPDEMIREHNPAELTNKIIDSLQEYDTTMLELLVTSILEHDLFAIATEIDERNVYIINKDTMGKSINDTKKTDDDGYDDRSMNSLVGNITVDTESIEDMKESEIVLHNTLPGQIPKANAEAVMKQIHSEDGSYVIRLDISVINGLLDLANEMVLARNQLLSITSDHIKLIPGISMVLQDLNRLTSEIQEKIMLTRMQPISVVFNRFPRMIRDTAKQLDKEIGIEIHGGDVTVDKYLLDALADPLTQLVKNSADHGIESSERRVALGKPEKGMITLHAYMHDGSAIIEVTDDGAGIDASKLKKKALEREIATQEQLAAMSESEAYKLILEPGFSTVSQVTNLSGRGVGMDIVKTNIEKLSGSIEIESQIGVGTTIRLRMPPTLSVVRTLIVSINSTRYAIPEANVDRILRIVHNIADRRLERVNDSLVLVLNNQVVPVVTIDEIDAVGRGCEMPNSIELLEKYTQRDVAKCLILRSGDRNFALMIDDAEDSEQTLIKPLPVFFQNCRCYSGVTVLGNGSAITILDPDGIMRMLGTKGVSRETLLDDYEDISVNPAKQYIVFRCSGPELFALELHEISRIEHISTASIQEIGKRFYVSISGETVHIVRPESYTPVKKKLYKREKLYVITLKNSSRPIGLLAGEVIDKIDGAFKYNTESIYNDYMFGTAVHEDKTILFLDIGAIINDVGNDKRKE